MESDPVSDRLTELVTRRDALVRRFADELLALDLEIGTQQRHNVTETTSSMLLGPYQDLAAQIAALRERMDAAGL